MTDTPTPSAEQTEAARAYTRRVLCVACEDNGVDEACGACLDEANRLAEVFRSRESALRAEIETGQRVWFDTNLKLVAAEAERDKLRAEIELLLHEGG